METIPRVTLGKHLVKPKYMYGMLNNVNHEAKTPNCTLMTLHKNYTIINLHCTHFLKYLFPINFDTKKKIKFLSSQAYWAYEMGLSFLISVKYQNKSGTDRNGVNDLYNDINFWHTANSCMELQHNKICRCLRAQSGGGLEGCLDNHTNKVSPDTLTL